jgi:hypothetical protein
VYWYTDHPDANYIEVNETTDIERRTQTTGPPGWKPAMLNPTQPATNYIAYRPSASRDGPAGRHAADDDPARQLGPQLQLGAVRRPDLPPRPQALEGWLERRTLNGLVRDVEAEARLYAAANPRWEHAAALRRRPARVDLPVDLAQAAARGPDQGGDRRADRARERHAPLQPTPGRPRLRTSRR